MRLLHQAEHTDGARQQQGHEPHSDVHARLPKLDTKSSHMMGVLGINGATVEMNLFEDDRGSNPFKAFQSAQEKGDLFKGCHQVLLEPNL